MDLPPPFTSLREAFADEHRSRIERYLHLTQQPADIIAAHFVELDEISRVIENDAYARYAALDADQQRLLLLFRVDRYPDDQLIEDYQLIFGKPISQVIQARELALDGNRYGYELKHGGRTRFVTSYGILGKGRRTALGIKLGLSDEGLSDSQCIIGEKPRFQLERSYRWSVLSDAWRLYDRLTTGNAPVTAKTAALYIPDYPAGRASPNQEILRP